MLLAAIIVVSLALILYSAAILPIVIRGRITKVCVLLLWAGFTADIVATGLMSMLSPGFHADLHTSIGIAALLFMAILLVLTTGHYRRIGSHVPLSLRLFAGTVWAIWLIVFVLGAGPR
jgi:hypothetical protein